MPIDVTLYSSLFPDDPDQPIRVRSGLTVENLLADIRREYDGLPEGDYILRAEKTGQALDRKKSLEAQGIKPKDVLVFELNHESLLPVSIEHPSPQSKSQQAVLIAENGMHFRIRRRPAQIGRPNADKRITSDMLDADLTALDNGSKKTVSRPHALMDEQGGIYNIVSLRAENPVYVNEQPVGTDAPRNLKPGDRIRCGSVVLRFQIED